ncbi:hypothetical protein R3P38DRAFT_3225479 [Favolaschia claudopus]|uniref:Uncharacterized protein n=1 Tax=Favolaschia claudopus TaxID=2862362 RepID=A0AAV9ZV38_9AGAR
MSLGPHRLDPPSTTDLGRQVYLLPILAMEGASHADSTLLDEDAAPLQRILQIQKRLLLLLPPFHPAVPPPPRPPSPSSSVILRMNLRTAFQGTPLPTPSSSRVAPDKAIIELHVTIHITPVALSQPPAYSYRRAPQGTAYFDTPRFTTPPRPFYGGAHGESARRSSARAPPVQTEILLPSFGSLVCVLATPQRSMRLSVSVVVDGAAWVWMGCLSVMGRRQWVGDGVTTDGDVEGEGDCEGGARGRSCLCTWWLLAVGERETGLLGRWSGAGGGEEREQEQDAQLVRERVSCRRFLQPQSSSYLPCALAALTFKLRDLTGRPIYCCVSCCEDGTKAPSIILLPLIPVHYTIHGAESRYTASSKGLTLRVGRFLRSSSIIPRWLSVRVSSGLAAYSYRTLDFAQGGGVIIELVNRDELSVATESSSPASLRCRRPHIATPSSHPPAADGVAHRPISPPASNRHALHHTPHPTSPAAYKLRIGRRRRTAALRNPARPIHCQASSGLATPEV